MNIIRLGRKDNQTGSRVAVASGPKPVVSRAYNPLTREEWAAWDTKNLNQAIRRYGGKSAGVIRSDAIRQVSRENAWRLDYMNPCAAEIWQTLLRRQLEAAGVRDQSPRMITVIEKRWNITTAVARIDLAAIRRKVKSALAGLDYVVLIEFAVHTDILWRVNLGEKRAAI